MFQKLYRHLEEMNDNLRRLETTVRSTSTCDKEILEELHLLNQKANQLELKATGKKPNWPFAAALILILGLAVGTLLFCNIRLAGISHSIIDDHRGVARKTEIECQKTNENHSESSQTLMAAQLIRLDSLISQQSQSLLELKKLNKFSIRTFNRLKQRINKTDSVIQSLQVDSRR